MFLSWFFRSAALILLLTIPLSSWAFSTRTESWTEDALLHDGRVINVSRKVDYTFQFVSGDEASMKLFSSWPDKYSIKFTNPDTQETIKWQGEQYYDPVLLDIVNGVPYLVVLGSPDKDTKTIYGCPEIPYIFLKYEKKRLKGKWMPLQQDKIPSVLNRNANLSPDYDTYYSGNSGSHRSLNDIKDRVAVADRGGNFSNKDPG